MRIYSDEIPDAAVREVDAVMDREIWRYEDMIEAANRRGVYNPRTARELVRRLLAVALQQGRAQRIDGRGGIVYGRRVKTPAGGDEGAARAEGEADEGDAPAAPTPARQGRLEGFASRPGGRRLAAKRNPWEALYKRGKGGESRE
jgi:hypothetical protein